MEPEMIPASITSQLSFLQSQVQSASPLNTAPHNTIVAIKLNAAQAVDSIDAAIPPASGGLDTWVTPVDPGDIIDGVLGLLGSAVDQNDLVNVRGYVGRSAENLNQIA